MSKLSRVILTLLLVAAAPRAMAAQKRADPLEGFVSSVARLWAAGNAGALAALAPEDGRIELDLGDGRAGAVEARHVGAALRELFGERTHVSVRAAGVTVSGGEPLRGFGELTWVSRPRGVTDAETSTVYIGAVWEEDGWKIREIRLLR